jgi:hypothetical protein
MRRAVAAAARFPRSGPQEWLAFILPSQGSPLTRFRRAVSGTSATNALAAAAELGSLDLDDALQLVLLLSEDPEKAPFGRYAVRWA